MFIITCDPGKKNCAIVVTEMTELIDLTIETRPIETTFKVCHSHTYDLTDSGTTSTSIVKRLTSILQDISTLYGITIAVVEVQGVNHGRNTLPTLVYNNVVFGAFYGFFSLELS